MSLPERWIDRLFDKLAVTYGQSFLRQYDGVPMDKVKANWATELACYQQNPQALARGLSQLPPDRAPTVLQFRELCKGPTEQQRLLQAPKPEPVNPVVAAKVKEAFKGKSGTDPKGWARDLKELESRGNGLTPFQRAAWREALGGTT
jgi:hypothetical protein